MTVLMQVFSKNKRGRRAKWEDKFVNDMVDVVCESEYFRKKLIFTNNKPQKNKEVCGKVLEELKKRNDGDFPFTIEQIRVKFKSCVSQCKKVSLLRMTASGIKNFVDEKSLGSWFFQLFTLISSRDSCQPEQAIEPSFESTLSSTNPDGNDNSEASGDENPSKEKCKKRELDENRSPPFVPVKKTKKDKKKNSQEELKSAIINFNNTLEKYNKDFLDYLKEENEQSRQHEREMFQMQCNIQLQMMQMLHAQQPHQGTIPAFTTPPPQNYSFQQYLQRDDV